jgi:hypothetical protein
MPIESATYISDLNASNPIGATDPLSSADDHLRLLKSTIKATFPAVTGAVTASHTELNNLAGVTGKTGTGNVVLSASPTLTGTLTAAAITASGTVTGNLFSGSGASLTSLPAGNLTGALPAISGASLTSLNATNISSGSLADARLSANVPLLNAANAFAANQTVSKAAARLSVTSTDTTNSHIQFSTNSTVRGYVGAEHNGGLVVGAVTGDMVIRAESGGVFFSGDGGSTAYLSLSSAGVVTRKNLSASEVGYAGSPLRSISASDNTVATDAGKTVRFTGGSGQTFTLDGDPPPDSRITLINSSGNNWTVAASGTLSHPTIGTGPRTMNTGATLEAHHLGSGSWYILSTGGTIT